MGFAKLMSLLHLANSEPEIMKRSASWRMKREKRFTQFHHYYTWLAQNRQSAICLRQGLRLLRQLADSATRGRRTSRQTANVKNSPAIGNGQFAMVRSL